MLRIGGGGVRSSFNPLPCFSGAWPSGQRSSPTADGAKTSTLKTSGRALARRPALPGHWAASTGRCRGASAIRLHPRCLSIASSFPGTAQSALSFPCSAPLGMKQMVSPQTLRKGFGGRDPDRTPLRRQPPGCPPQRNEGGRGHGHGKQRPGALRLCPTGRGRGKRRGGAGGGGSGHHKALREGVAPRARQETWSTRLTR